MPRIVAAVTINLRAPSLGPSTPSLLPVSNHSFMSQSHPIPARANIYEVEELEVINHPALYETTPSAETHYLVRPAQSRLISEGEDVESLVHEIRSEYFVLSRCALDTVFDPTRVLFGWLCELLGQKGALPAATHFRSRRCENLSRQRTKTRRR